MGCGTTQETTRGKQTASRKKKHQLLQYVPDKSSAIGKKDDQPLKEVPYEMVKEQEKTGQDEDSKLRTNKTISNAVANLDAEPVSEEKEEKKAKTLYFRKEYGNCEL